MRPLVLMSLLCALPLLGCGSHTSPKAAAPGPSSSFVPSKACKVVDMRLFVKTFGTVPSFETPQTTKQPGAPDIAVCVLQIKGDEAPGLIVFTCPATCSRTFAAVLSRRRDPDQQTRLSSFEVLVKPFHETIMRNAAGAWVDVSIDDISTPPKVNNADAASHDLAVSILKNLQD